MPSEMIIKNGERSQCERFHRYPFLTAPGQERNDAMPGATLAADTEESNSEDEDVDGQDGQDGHVADTGHEGEHGSRDGHSQTDGEGYTEFSGVSPTSAMYEDDFSQVSPDSGALSPSSPSSPLSPGDAAADMALAAVGTARGDATEPSQRSPASPASPPLVSASEAPETPGAEAPEASEATEASEASEYGDDFEDRAQDAQVNTLVAEKDRTAACCRLQPFSPFVWRRNHAIVPFFGMFRVKEVGHERFGLKASVSPRFLCFGRCSIANSRHLTAHLPCQVKDWVAEWIGSKNGRFSITWLQFNQLSSTSVFFANIFGETNSWKRQKKWFDLRPKSPGNSNTCSWIVLECWYVFVCSL